MSEAQLKSIVIIPKITGGLSMIGSALICWDILKDRRTKLHKVYHRLLLVMSVMDIFLSFSLFLSTWPIPRDTEGAPWLASGNDATCTAQGFAQVFFMPSLFYNAYLSIYYVLVIVYNWPEHKIVPLERGAHVFTFVFACVTAFTALALEMYGSNFLVWCFIDVSWNIQLAINIAWQWLAFCIVFVNMLFLSWKIGQQFRTTRKYGEARLRASIQEKEEKNKRPSRTSWLTRPSLVVQSWKRKSQIKNPMASIKTQAALYALSFLLSESSNVAVSIAYYTNEGNQVPAWVLQYALITLPLQGFWNCLIHFRPKFLRWYKARQKRKRQSEMSTQKMTDNCNTMLADYGCQPSSTLGESAHRPRGKKTSTVVFLSMQPEESSGDLIDSDDELADMDLTESSHNAEQDADAIAHSHQASEVLGEGTVDIESASESVSTIPEIEMFYSARDFLSSRSEEESSIAALEASRFPADSMHSSTREDSSGNHSSSHNDSFNYSNHSDSWNASLHSVDAAHIVAAFSKARPKGRTEDRSSQPDTSPASDRYTRRASGQRLARGSFRLSATEEVEEEDQSRCDESSEMRASGHRLARGSFRTFAPEELSEKDGGSDRRASGQRLARGSFRMSRRVLQEFKEMRDEDDDSEVEFYSASDLEAAVYSGLRQAGEARWAPDPATEAVEEEKYPI